MMVSAAGRALADRTREASARKSRRAFLRSTAKLSLVGAGLALLDACGLVPTPTQTARVARVGVLTFDDGTGMRWDAFRRGLRDLGWLDGHNLTVD